MANTARRTSTMAFGALAGAGAWTLSEYVAHRWLMHGPLARLRHNALGAEHRAHHVDPAATRPERRAAGYTAVALTVAGLARMNGAGTAGQSAAVAWFAGYAAYELFHWREHHRPPLGCWEEQARRRHATHHASTPRANFGVTTPWWDRAFGTYVEPPATPVTASDHPGGVLLARR